jgi:hypothetical protein
MVSNINPSQYDRARGAGQSRGPARGQQGQVRARASLLARLGAIDCEGEAVLN